MHEIALVATYFGQLPTWIDDYVETCKHNPTVAWFLFSDAAAPRNQASNFNFVPLTLPAFNALAAQRLRIRAKVSHGYKTCDFRPAYGALFSDHLSGFHFWGHCDLDVVWGSLRRFLTESLLTDYDVISSSAGGLCGPCTIFRNCESINCLFRRAPFEQILTDPANQVFDEHGFDAIVKQASAAGELRLLLRALHEYDGFHPGIQPGETACVWQAGKLFCVPEQRELMYYHFAASKRWAWRTTWTPRSAAIANSSLATPRIAPASTPVETSRDAPAVIADFVVTALMTHASDPTASASKIGLAADSAKRPNALATASLANLYDYMRPWYESLHAHPGLHGLVLHDRLPVPFVERWRSRQVAFQSYQAPDRYVEQTSVYIQRMAMLLKFLAARADIRRIWFTDINDVGFVRNPFHWMDQFPLGETWLFAGEEWTIFRKSEWWSERAAYLGGEYVALFSGPFADMYLVNAGVWGGHAATVQSFLLEFMQEVDRLLDAGFDLRNPPGGSADMAVFNLLMYKRFFARLVTFKLEARAGQLVFEAGAFIRSAGNPMIHHRPAALKVVEELHATRSSRPVNGE